MNSKRIISQILLSILITLLSNCGILFLKPKAGEGKVNPLLALFAFLPTANSSNPTSSTPVTATYVVSNTPDKDATVVSVNSSITITFVNAIDLNTVNLNNFTVTSGGVAVTGTYTLSSEQFIFTPSSPLNYGTTYTVNIQPSVKYLSGNSVEASYSFQFQTELAPDNTALAVTGTTPMDFDVFIPENQVIEVTFNKQVNPSSVLSNSISAVDNLGNTIAGTTLVAGNVSNKILFYPSSYFPVWSTITITVSSTVRDLFGNSLGSNYTFTFETGETQGPFLVSSTPSAQGFGVSVNASITLNFNKDLFAPFVDDFSVYLLEDTDEKITGTYVVSGSQVVFTPSSPLKKKTRYRMYVTNFVTDWSFNPATPAVIPFTTEVPVQMALGDGFSCYLSSAGKVRCWGFNFVGQLGTGEERFNQPDALQSKEIQFEEKALEITAGLHHACARFTSGRVKCWGGNVSGALGTGNNLDVKDAAKAPYIILPDLAKKISANYLNTCVILRTEKIACWGDNVDETLGFGFGYWDTSEDPDVFKPDRFVNTPMLRKTIEVNDKFKDISVGKNFFCGFLKDFFTRCWGNGNNFQLGFNSIDILNFFSNFIVSSANFIDFSLQLYLGGVQQISSGETHTCVLFSGTLQVICWGTWDFHIVNIDIYLNPDPVIFAYTALPFEFGSNITYLSLRFRHACVVFDSGKVLCWGSNNFYALGFGNNTLDYKPTQVASVLKHPGSSYSDQMYLGEKAIAIETSTSFTCAIFESGRFKCWGDNAFGQLGYGHTNTVSDAVNAPILSF